VLEQADRSPGKKRDPVKSRRRILDAAVRHFGQRGLHGGRVEEILAEAGLSHRMLYHYFGDKEGLYLATLEHAYEQIRSAEQALNLDAMEPEDALRAFVTFSFDYAAENPDLMRLFYQEDLLEAAHLSRSTRIGALHEPLILTLDRLLERGVTMGVFAPWIDPVQLYFSIAGCAGFALSNRFILSTIFGRDMTSPYFLQERRQHVIDFVMTAVRP